MNISMEQEEWKPVVGYENNYEVSNLGRVRSQSRRGTRGGILKPSPDIWGYLYVGLCKNGEKETCQVHQLVMESFVGRCPDGCEVDHIDWNPSNNRLDNLSYQPKGINRARRSPEWKKNHSEANKKLAQDPEWRKSHAEAMRRTKSKPVNQYTLGGIFVKTWESAREIERELGINNSNISQCCNEKRKKAGGFIWKYAVCST